MEPKTVTGRRSALSPGTRPAAGSITRWSRLYGSSKALAIVSEAASTDVPLLVLVAEPTAAASLLEEMQFYQPGTGMEFPILQFPGWETLPYDLFSPYQDLVSERLTLLSMLPSLRRGIVVTTVAAAMHRLLPGDLLRRHSLVLKSGQALNLDQFRSDLTASGYRVVSQVQEHGELAVRGSLLDLFPMGADAPLRIDLLDDVIDSIRSFDAETQRSMQPVAEIRILPASEVVLTDATIARFRGGWRGRFPGNPGNSPIYVDVSKGLAPAGIESYLPLFYEATQGLFEYLEQGCTLVLDDDATAAVPAFWEEAAARFEQLRHDRERPILPPQELFYTPEEFQAQTARAARIHVTGLGGDDAAGVMEFATSVPVAMPIDARARDPIALFRRFVEGFAGRVLVVAETPGRRETLLELFAKNALHPVTLSSWREFLESSHALALVVAPLENGAQLEAPPIAVISESQLFGERALQRRRRRRAPDNDTLLRSLGELSAGVPVVHEQHGIGRFLDLVTQVTDGVQAEYIRIEYEQGDLLYVPVSSIERIGRYTGVDPEHAPLHRLGSGQWLKARQRAAEQAHDVAAELLELHARRAARPGLLYELPADDYSAFVQRFPFEETPGQHDAIDAVLGDMQAARPMDRLICGDSGFGKTEVAMRAAFVAVLNNRQVLLLAPTTLLAQQHHQNFRDRFADWPVRIEVLSRFVAKGEQQRIVAELNAGKVDIAIGTHRLLQKDVRPPNLGLAILDEEHRFGVRQKEQLKSLRAEVDVLTLTATPIPRTLSMALSDIRDLSIISTPPARRLAVKTFVREWNEALVREALLREIRRGGQVYFLHNDIDSIEARAREVEKLLPDARVRVAHGQMPERLLERVMLDFYHRRFNVLVCTTIIETGIDVPNANTIIIERADKFGLAQLYQLRGRVGRSHHRAYAYFIIPPRQALKGDAIRRLEAIESLEELGIGFTLATHDLEIRGAGAILGEEQSGQIHEVGYAMYMELLDRAVRALKSGRQWRLEEDVDRLVEIDLRIPALIPEDYLPDVHSRIILYKRLAATRDAGELSALAEEIVDRFGVLPPPLRNLVDITRLKQRAQAMGVRKIELGAKGGRISFGAEPRVDGARIIRLVQTEPQTFRFDGRDKLRITRESADARERIALISELLDQMETRSAA